ncbi:hypothetical protein DFR42_105241 [Undibacterium pigrum]|uniref:Uncharacterized protein n=1 Tax=Undibacterium pigrum TaxID=401470 RepID=A0A318J592_9BURK|nr:hypothetical protein DFR42_105241 [Undibacterium pigrum]
MVTIMRSDAALFRRMQTEYLSLHVQEQESSSLEDYY